jgi:hypothetical protein
VTERKGRLNKAWWGVKFGGLPFHEYIFSHYFPDGQEPSGRPHPNASRERVAASFSGSEQFRPIVVGSPVC